MDTTNEKENTIMETTTKMTCDDFTAALKRGDFTSNDLYNIARWAKQAKTRMDKAGIAGARPGQTLVLTDNDGTTVRVTLDKVNRTKAECTLLDSLGKFDAGDEITVPISMLSTVADNASGTGR